MMEEEKYEDEEVEVWEFSLCDDEIDELIEKLTKLKETKNEISFEIDDENELLIKYDGGEG
jgi:hypothetical protein